MKLELKLLQMMLYDWKCVWTLAQIFTFTRILFCVGVGQGCQLSLPIETKLNMFFSE